MSALAARPRADGGAVLRVLGQRDWTTAADVAEVLGLPRERTIDVVRTLNDLRTAGAVHRGTIVHDDPADDTAVAYWMVTA